MSIAILTPSRNRPDRLWEMLDAIDRTSVEPESIHVYVGVDDDDLTVDEYVALAGDWQSVHQDLKFTLITDRRKNLAAWTNDLARTAIAHHHQILASFGDDHRPRTHGWDEHVRTAMDDIGSGLVYADDGLQGERLPTAPFWTADIIQALGWYFPPAQKHLYADDFWYAFADGLGRRCYLPNVLIEHMHPSVGKAVADAVNESNDAHYDADREAFNTYMRDQYQTDLARVREIL